MNNKFTPPNIEFNSQLSSLPSTWFESRITLEQIRSCFSAATEEIRIASGFFTIKGWGLIRNTTQGKRVYLLVGIDEPGEERARAVLVKEILRDLATGRDRERRASVQDLVDKMESGLLRMVDARATSHHGKLYIVDRTVAIVASANTTGRGFLDQKEAGGLYGPSLIERFIEESATEVAIEVIEGLHQFIKNLVANYIDKFDEYFAIAKDITQELLAALKRWLELASPWDIYLKTLLALEEVTPVKSSYNKTPVSYQQDMIAQTLRQIREYGGSMLVASTGLGKTVVGVHVAIHLKAEDIIDKVIIICPNAVRSAWKREMREASIFSDYFNLEILDKKIDDAHALEDWEEICQSIDQHRWLLILDESHKLRKRYPGNYNNNKYRLEAKTERKAFTRLLEIVKSGQVKVLLLTGSPYATDEDNINTQLLLLPHTNESHALFPEFVDGKAWRINDIDEFVNLPVASQLTTPHVAKYYGQINSDGIYIDFNEIKKYVPELILHSIYVVLPFFSEIANVLAKGYFDLDNSHPTYRKNIEIQVKKSWASSLLALQEILERTVDTPGGKREFDFSKERTSEFVFSKSERQEALNPIIKKISNLSFEQDLKIQTVVAILQKHSNQEKVIIFCERHITAFYLEQALKQLLPELRVFSTIIKKSQSLSNIDYPQYEPKKLKDIELAIAKFAPIANYAVGKYGETYDVFIATDAYGIGVNMQDASIVINYDIAWTPVEPIQRAGRILRLWDCPRHVQVYTFIPTMTDSANIKYELLKIRQRWEKLMDRHSQSQKIIDLPVLTANTREEVYMPDVAPEKVVIKSGKLKFDIADDKSVSPFFKETAQLQMNRHYAEEIDSDIVSAKTYKGQTPLIYVLLKHNDKYYWPMYDPKNKQLREPTAPHLLDLIRCTQDTEVAWVESELIEELSDACISAWCDRHGVDEKEVIRECALYLKPETEGDAGPGWLNKPVHTP